MGFRQNQDRKPEDFVTIDGETTTVMIKIKVAQSTMIPNVPQNNHFFLFKLIERRRQPLDFKNNKIPCIVYLVLK